MSGQAVPSSSAEPLALRLRGITKSFGGVTVVDNINLDLEEGGRLAIIGPNGAGKTTLFRMIAGELGVSGGGILLFGDDVTQVSERTRARQGVVRTFQVSNLFPSLTVLDNVRLAAQASTRTSRAFWRPVATEDVYGQRSKGVLKDVGLAGRTCDIVSDLSHGEQRQLEIAMALVSEPRLLLLDEPAAGLSGAERVVLRRLLEALPRTLTYVLIEHDMSLALELTDRVLCLDNGTMLASGTPAEIRANEKVQAVYLGRRP